jgi:hypothetical protein
MTEDEWLASHSPHALLWHLRRTQRTAAARRKLRLFACADVRRSFPKLPDERLAPALAAAEEFADGGLTQDEARRASGLVSGFFHWLKEPAVYRIHALFNTRISDLLNIYTEFNQSGRDADLLRDVFGNPFRPVPFNPNWRTSSAIALAKTMYDARDFSAMPILSDALQDAGCENTDILAHCRTPGTHVRGCWVVDLVLGKT